MKHCTTKRNIFARSAIALAMLALSPFATVSAAEQAIPKPDGKPAAPTKMVKVFILMGQSNMVGMGDIQGGGTGWRTALKKPVLSVYEGAYSPGADYDKLVANNYNQTIIVSANDDKAEAVMTLPFTCGRWQESAPVNITLKEGENVLHVSRFNPPQAGIAVKSFTLKPLQ